MHMQAEQGATPVTALVSDAAFLEHRTHEGHPECPARLGATLAGIAQAVPETALLRLAPRPAADEDLLRGHTATYLETVRAEVAAGRATLSTGDTDLSARSEAVARLAAGAGLTALDAVFDGRVRNAFCAVRPPGHHATRDRGMGFCLFNNVAVAARYAQQRHGVTRVLIVDWDVHHGNGTQDIFYEDPTVFFFSLHQWPLYPGTGAVTETGAGAGAGFTLNRGLAAGATGAEALAAFELDLYPAMARFQPELVLLSAGFDAREDEPLSNLEWTDAEFGRLTRGLMDLADRHAGGRLVSFLEGGYNLAGLARAAGEHVRVLAGGAPR